MAGVTVDFNANLARLEEGVNRANQQLSNFGDNAARLAGGLKSAFGALGVGLSVAGMTSLVKATLDEADALDELNAKTGIAVDKLAGLVKIPDLAGKGFDAIAAPFSRLAKQIETNGEALAALGITARDPLIAFEQLADVFVKIEDPTQRAAVMNGILGKSWQDLAPLLANGGQAIAEMVDSAAAASGVTAELAKESAEFNDRLAVLEGNLQGFRNNALGPLIPVLNDLADYFSDSGDKAEAFTDKSSALSSTYKLIAESIGVVGFGAEVAGKGVGALAAKLEAIATLNFDRFDAIDQAFKEDVAAADKRLLEFFAKVEGDHPEVTLDVKTNVSGAPGAAVDLDSNNQAIDDFLGNTEKAQKTVSESIKQLQGELNHYLKGVEGNIETEIGLYDFRNKQLEISLDLGLISQEAYYQKKAQMQKDQLSETLALLGQEINALKQFQAEASEQSARNDAQDQINELIRKKTELERESQIATLENAAAARKALGEYAAGLVDVNDLLAGVTSNIIGMSKAQAEVNFNTSGAGGGATEADLADPNKIFRSADGKSFSDRPTAVGVELELSQDQVNNFNEQLDQVKQQAVEGSAVLLGVSIDEAAAMAKINEAASSINQQLAEVRPISLSLEADQEKAIESAKAARDAAQANITPVVIPVIYQEQNSPNTAAPAFDLRQTALANGGR